MMPFEEYSAFRHLLKKSTNTLVPEYMDSNGVGVRPAAEATFIIRPLPLKNNVDTSGNSYS